MRWLSILLMSFAGSAWADGYDLRSGDAVLGAAHLQSFLPGRTLTFYDDGQSHYYDDGRYTYTYANDGGTAYGYWSIGDDDAVCVAFVTGFSRCDLYVEARGRLILLDGRGDRYPVRPWDTE